MTETAFSLRGVGYRIGAATILDDVTLDIPYGRLLALVGPNGAGKSTLLGVLTGDVAPSVGEVTLDGVPLSQWSARDLSRARAVLLQSNHVAFSFTAADVVEMGRAPWLGATRGRRAGAAGARPAGSVDGASVAPDGGVDADERAIAEAMALADVSHLADRAYPSLSGGEKARVSLARVLAQETRVVMLDEPTAALDLRHQEDVLTIASTLAAEGRAVVVVLHDLSLAAAYADDIAIIDAGRVVALGSPAEVLTEERIGEVYGTPVRVLPDPDTGRPVVLPRRLPTMVASSAH